MFTLRINRSVIDRLDRQARRRGIQRTPLAERYLEEAVSMAEHPGIMFMDGAAGRAAALAGHRLRVWQVVETVQDEDGDLAAAAEYLSLPVGLVQAAMGYYLDHREEIEGQIRDNHEIATQAEAAWLRQRSAPER